MKLEIVLISKHKSLKSANTEELYKKNSWLVEEKRKKQNKKEARNTSLHRNYPIIES
jgi:hypothetical protein